MNKFNENQLRLSVVLAYAQIALAIIIQLVYTPFLIRILGDNEYGLLQTALSTVAMLSVLSLGFNSSYIRYYARYKQARDEMAIYKLNGLFLILFCLLGSVVLTSGFFLAEHLEWVLDDGLTSAEYQLGKVLLCIVTLNMALSFPRSVFANIISAHEKFVYLKAVAIIETLGGPILSILVLLMGYRSVAVAVMTLCAGCIVFLLYGYYCFFVLRQKFIFSGFEKGLLGNLFRFTGFIMINMLVDQVNGQVDNILLARFCGTAVVALYAVGINFSNIYTRFSTAISGVFTPRIHQMVLSTEKNLVQQRKILTGFFTKVGRIQFMMLALIASGFVFFGKPFLNLWVGPGYEEAYYVALVVMLPGTIPLCQNVGIEIQRAQNKHHYRSYIYGTMALLNLIVSIYLCQIWGAFGAAIGTGLACILANILIMNIVYYYKINVDVVVFFRSMARQLVGMFPAFVVGIVLMQWVEIRSWLHLLGCIFIYVVAYCISVFLFSMNQEEQGIIRKICLRFICIGERK